MRHALRVTASNHQPLGVLTCVGEVDYYSCDPLKTAADALVDGGCTRLLFDLSGVTYMDSSGIQLLVECRERVSPHSGTVELVGCSHTIHRILEVTRLKPYFVFYETVSDAFCTLVDLPGLVAMSSGSRAAPEGTTKRVLR